MNDKYKKKYCVLYKNKNMDQEFFSGYYETEDKAIEIATKIKKLFDEVRVIEKIKIIGMQLVR